MERGRIVVTVSLALVAAIALAPTAAFAERFQGGRVGGHAMGLGGHATGVGGHATGLGGHAMGRGPASGRSFVSRPFGPRHHFPRPFSPHHFPRRHFFRSFTPFGVVGFPVVVYAAPELYASPVYYGQPSYYDSPPVYSPPVGGAVSVAPAPPPPPPAPSVIEYPTGRYELRGDGVRTPYTWEWIPNPSPPPPPAAPPASDGDPSPPRHSELHSWTDEQGVLHFTSR